MQDNPTGTRADGLTIEGQHVIVSGLVLVDWKWSGIEFAYPSKSDTLQMGYVGVDANGNAKPNKIGIRIDPRTFGITLGGSTFTGADGRGYNARNFVSGNTDTGILIQSSSNFVYNDYVGTNLAGTAPIANGGQGLVIQSDDTKNPAFNNLIGALAVTGLQTASLYNVISGNATDGIWITGVGAMASKVAGNFIGTDSSGENVGTGTSKMGNGGAGVRVGGGATANFIGAAVATDANGVITEPANVISGNRGYGVLLTDAATSKNSVLGNFIGSHRQSSEWGAGGRQ